MNCRPVCAKISARGTRLKARSITPLRAGIAVVIRLAEDFVLLVEQHEVHAPGVRADGDDLLAELLPGERQAVLDLRPEPQHIPAEGVAEQRPGRWESGGLLRA